MQALTPRCRPLIVMPLVVLLSVLTPGCGWQKTMTFPSPSRKAAIEIWQTRFVNEWGFQVELVTGQRRIVLDKITREAIIYFVHVYWSPDEERVGVVATGLNICRVASDVKTGKAIPFADIRKDVGQSISKTYNVPQGEDPVDWAWSNDAGFAFSKLHPEIHLSYRPN